jgi:hypothetical protein
MHHLIKYPLHAEANRPIERGIIIIIGYCGFFIKWLARIMFGISFVFTIAIMLLLYVHLKILNYHNLASYNGIRLQDSISNVDLFLGPPTYTCEQDKIAYQVYYKINSETNYSSMVVFESKEGKITGINVSANDKYLQDKINIEADISPEDIESSWGKGKFTSFAPDELQLSYNKDVGIIFFSQLQNITFRFFRGHLYSVKLTSGREKSIKDLGGMRMHPCAV